jgi:hypothetical protein
MQHQRTAFRANRFRIVEVFFNILIYSKNFVGALRKSACQRRADLLTSKCHEWPRANLDGGRKQGLEVPTPHPCPPDRPSEPRRSVLWTTGGWARRMFHAAAIRTPSGAARGR